MVLDLTLAKAPLPTFAGNELARTLMEIVAEGKVDYLLKGHRYAGTVEDRKAGAKWLAPRFESELSDDRVIVTNGTKSAVLSLLSHLLSAGDLVATEELSSLGIWSIPEILGLRHVGLECDPQGIVPAAFQEQCEREAPKVLFTVPTLNNPTTQTMSEQRRREIAEIARGFGVTVVEDDICGRFKSEGPFAIASLAPDITWLASGLAKCVGSGVRTGYIVAPSAEDAQRFVSRFRALSSWHPAPLMAEVATRWINGGAAERIFAAVRAELALRQECAARVFVDDDIRSDPASLFVWLPLSDPRGDDAVVEAIRQKHVVTRSVGIYAVQPNSAPRALRICVGSPETVGQLEEALTIVRESIRA
ncbi:PLP-dependent aminotransferase family protein [Phyllobacterium zundukense]|uniref:PLP-dependent aminotransferase family protein n=1 Tax=Phyllobacterium zundukense TaxID=1867719 RepID=A0ACD4CVE0_9HYPH|nr:PLP-dependent aminotransferase family protein [Phyllobacterium zundukense]UXN57523.1 PLP-dependent aminotransferase family protein [Phyllobacterium zundukense]